MSPTLGLGIDGGGPLAAPCTLTVPLRLLKACAVVVLCLAMLRMTFLWVWVWVWTDGSPVM